MGVPTETQPVQQPLPTEQAGTDQDIVPAATYTSQAPPVYEKIETPGVPRNDDPAQSELAMKESSAVPVGMMVTPLQNLGPDPAYIDCPFCHQRTQTNVQKKESDTTWIYAILCCLCCGIICVLFPLLLHWANDFDHICMNCGNRVAHVPHDGGSGMVKVFGPPQPSTAIQAQQAPNALQAQQPSNALQSRQPSNAMLAQQPSIAMQSQQPSEAMQAQQPSNVKQTQQ